MSEGEEVVDIDFLPCPWEAVAQRMQEDLSRNPPPLNDSKESRDDADSEASTDFESEIEGEFAYSLRASMSHRFKKDKILLAAFKDFRAAYRDLLSEARRIRAHWRGGLKAHQERRLANWRAGEGEIDSRGTGALRRLDAALLKCVAQRREVLGERLILTRIAVAEDLGDNDFFHALGKAVMRRVTPHKGAKRDRALKAANLMDKGLSWQQVYDQLCDSEEWGSNDPSPTEFYTFLQDHGVIPRKRRKP